MAAAAQGPPVPVVLPYGSAIVTDFKGNILVSLPQVPPMPVQKGQTLPPESSIETNKGSLVLSFADGSQVLIKPQSRVVLKSPEQSNGNYLELLLGKLLAKVQKRLGQEPSFRMGTPTAVITVRGTYFGVEVTKKNKTYVQVYEGLVEVYGLGLPAKPLMVRPGFMTEVENNGSPQNPHHIQEGEGYAGSGNDGSSAERQNKAPVGRNSESDTAAAPNQQKPQGESQGENVARPKPNGPD
jgi:hypothetical protein